MSPGRAGPTFLLLKLDGPATAQHRVQVLLVVDLVDELADRACHHVQVGVLVAIDLLSLQDFIKLSA